MRVDANVSVRPRGETELGAKAEVKNMNSFKALHDALAYEIVRQADELEAGGTIEQETRHWDAGQKRTSSLRSKEYAHDYRYFPEPDMVPFTFDDAYIEALRDSAARAARRPQASASRARTGCRAHDATVLAGDLELGAYFEEAVEAAGGPARAKAVANWVLGDFSAHLNADGAAAAPTPTVTPAQAGAARRARRRRDDLGQAGQDGLRRDGRAAARSRGRSSSASGMEQVSDSGEIEAVVDTVLAANPNEVEGYRGGKTGLIGFFVGQVMREMRGQANPAVVNEVLRAKLGG